MDPLDILIRYVKCAVIVILTCASLLKITSAAGGLLQRVCIGPAKFPERAIDQLWPVLTREPQDHIPWSSCWRSRSHILSRAAVLAKPTMGFLFHHAGAGGKWSGRFAECMADNFAWMIENYGHIPNGNAPII